jgi:hypothetical protein
MEINEIMQQFHEQQNGLNEMHQVSIRNHNTRMTADLARLKQEHNERQAKLFEKIEQQAQREYEELMKEHQRQEEVKHSEELQSLQTTIEETKARIKLLVVKMDGFVGETDSRMSQFGNGTDMLVELQGGFSLRSRVEDQQRILANLDAVARQKADVLREFAGAMTQEVARFEKEMRGD